MLPLGFASGLPNPLVGSTLTAWMALEGVSLKTIGLFGLVALPYNLKFLWAPLLDRFALPFLGRRRGWMLVSQLALLVAIAALGSSSPTQSPLTIASLALAVAFLSASQDIVADAYRTDSLAVHERASGAAIFVATYRLALIVAGAGCLILSDFLSWQLIYLLMASLLLVGIGGTFMAPQPQREVRPPSRLREAVVEPLHEFFTREGAFVALTIVVLYKVGDAVAGHLLTPYLIEMGFSGTEIGGVQKGLGMAATIGGALVGGGLVARFGLRPSLIVFGVLQALANALYALLLLTGKSHSMLIVAVGVDNICNGLGTAAFVAYLMTLCDPRYSATQFALLSSAMGIGGRILGSGGGFLAERFGWLSFFVVTIVLAIPAIVLLALRPIVGANGATTSVEIEAERSPLPALQERGE